MTKKNCTKKAGKIIQIDEVGIKDHLGEIVRGTVQETLNTLLDEEADTGFVMPGDMSGRRLVRIPGQAPTEGDFIPKQEK